MPSVVQHRVIVIKTQTAANKLKRESAQAPSLTFVQNPNRAILLYHTRLNGRSFKQCFRYLIKSDDRFAVIDHGKIFLVLTRNMIGMPDHKPGP